MFRLAINNLLTRKFRSFLSLIGLSIAIVGIIAFLSVSAGIKASAWSTISMMEGITVLQKGDMEGLFSKLDAGYLQELKSIPGVERVIPYTLNLVPFVEGKTTLLRGMRSIVMSIGIDPADVIKYPEGVFYSRSLKKGQPLEPGDVKEALISSVLAKRYNKGLGDSINIQNQKFSIKGIYETGSPFLDLMVIVPIATARQIFKLDENVVSSFMVTVEDPRQVKRVEQEIEKRLPVNAKITSEWTDELSDMGRMMDLSLLLISSLAIIIGTIGILNTMLMSVTERVSEFGILKANGWTNSNVMKLVMFESLGLGITGGMLGCLGGTALIKLAGLLLVIKPVTTVWLLGASFALAVLLGVIGGVYPAYRAARMNPIDAIRTK